MDVSFAVAVIVGALLGTLSGIGIGGGSLLILWLTIIVKMEPLTARCINLMFFVPCALCASGLCLLSGRLPLKKILLPMALGCATAAVFSIFSSKIDTQLLQKGFGVLLLVTGVRELFYRKKQ